ncbi:hypothetical protein [Brachybacterium kimchii]|uniref:Uncharacterized protein n=1 Tax=Brachybacterium kimchii TaxID=2942909 RepID=A0ABY4NB89_9MICO|nr:hypothetical protein [Brachybacterium kimchii]UQN31814.1 hypothetical protein M4486_19685 [Brachybacterium kimchii]
MEDLNTALATTFKAMLDDELTAPVGSARTVREFFDLLAQRDYATTDHALHTLLARLGTDRQARDLLLHAMRPTIAKFALELFHKNRQKIQRADDAFVIVIEAFYDVIEKTTIRSKTTRVAARIKWELRDEINSRMAFECSRDINIWNSEFALTEAARFNPEGKSEHESQIDLLEGLAWARDKNVISLDEARFLIAIYSPDSGISLDRDFDLGDLSDAAVRKRASRLAQRIAQAITNDHDLLADMAREAL